TTRLDVDDLARLRSALNSIQRGALPPLRGRAALAVTAHGAGVSVVAPDGWTIDLDGRIPRASVGASSFRGLARGARLGHLTKSDGHAEAALLRLALAYPGTVWRNEGAGAIALGRGAVSIHDVRLQAGEQRLAADVDRDEHRISAAVKVEALRLQA